MAFKIFNRSFGAAAIGAIMLLTLQSCKESPHKTDKPVIRKEANLHFIDSLLSLCQATLDSARKGNNRKDILVKGQQLMQQTEKLVENAQYKLDTLANMVVLEATTTLQYGDSIMARKRIAYASNIYRRTGNNKGLSKSYIITSLFLKAKIDSIEIMVALDSASQIALAAHDTLTYYNAVFKKARLYEKINQKDKYLQVLLNLLEFQRTNFRINISQTAYAIAGHYVMAHNDTSAFKYYLEAIENLNNDSNRFNHHANYYEQIGYIYYDMANYQEARKSFDKALELASKPGDESAERASMAIGWIEACYKIEHKYRAGIDHMKQLISKFPPVNDSGKVRLAHNMLELYMLNGQYKEAAHYADELLDYDKRGRVSEENRQFTYELIGTLCVYMNNPNEARIYLLKAHELAKQTNDLMSLAEDSRQLFILDSADGKYLDAIRWFGNYRTYVDARRAQNHLKELRELDIKYATDKRIDSLKTLTERTELQHSLIQQTSFVRNLFLGMAILLVLVLVILFGRYQLKQRVNKQLAENQRKIYQQNQALEQLIEDERKLLFEKTTFLSEKTQLLVEKEWLVKEIHHRVKNNFHMVASLLEIQSSYLKSEDALSAIRESQNRIHAMSIIHQKLYQSETLSIINMPEYVYELVEFLRESYGIRKNIIFTLAIENIKLDHDVATKIGLILNEAITNAIKYAFTNTKEGKITISLNHISGSQILLTIIDNGTGLPADFNNNAGNSMGMELLYGLTEDIKGNFSIETKNGTHIRIVFQNIPTRTEDIPFRS